MQPKLKEDPREWLKFTAVMAVALAVVGALLWRRHWLSGMAWGCLAASLAGVVAICWFKPRVFRGFYRLGMTASFHVGQVMGRVLLGAIFLLVLTPLGLVLRLMGKDLLALRRRNNVRSHWTQARPPGRLDQQF